MSGGRRAWSAVALATWIATLVIVGIGLVRLGQGPLAAPPIAKGVDSVRQWSAARDAPTIVVAALRVAALGLDAYLVVTTTLGAVARLTRSLTAVRLLDRVTPSSARRLLVAALGGVLLSAPVTIPASRFAPRGVHAASAPPTLRRLDTRSTRLPPRRIAGGPPPARPPAHAPDEPPSVWVVRPGDNFWLIAERVLGERGPASPAAVAPYWRVLIAENRSAVRDPHWIWPGQRFVLPRPP